VSDDDDDDNMLNLAQFDKNLIELPPESPQVGGGLPGENRPKVNNAIQYKADGRIIFSGIYVVLLRFLLTTLALV